MLLKLHFKTLFFDIQFSYPQSTSTFCIFKPPHLRHFRGFSMLIPSYSAFLRFSDFAWRATAYRSSLRQDHTWRQTKKGCSNSPLVYRKSVRPTSHLFRTFPTYFVLDPYPLGFFIVSEIRFFFRSTLSTQTLTTSPTFTTSRGCFIYLSHI